jgi:predicted dinucleotide-binding enzyme
MKIAIIGAGNVGSALGLGVRRDPAEALMSLAHSAGTFCFASN